MPTGCAYVVQRRVNGRTVRAVIGKFPELSPEEALGQAFLDFKNATQLRPKTLVVYDGAMRRCFAEWSNRSLASITKQDIEQKMKELSNHVGKRSSENGAHAQANQAMRVLRRVFNYAISRYEFDDGRPLIAANPVAHLSKLKLWNKSKRRRDIISEKDLPRWYAALQQHGQETTRDFILLCLFTGLRRTEASRLNGNT